MENEEYNEIMRELYKFLRDKINISLKDYLTEKQKEDLYTFEPEKIIVSKETNKIVEYKKVDDKIYISDEFLTPEYIEKIKAKNPDFEIESLKNRVNNEEPKILLEELIVFSDELKITEKDLIKSLFIQEILKMVLLNDEMDAKEDVVMIGTIELLAHTLGNENGFLVSTPKKYLAELEVAISLKNELEDKFLSLILNGNVLDYISRIQNHALLEKIDELADDRKIIESTQNLDNVIDSIVQMTGENKEIIESEEEKNEVVEIKEESQETLNLEPGQVDKEDVVIVDENNAAEPNNINTNDTEMNNLESSDEPTKSSKNVKVVILILLAVVVILLGILTGYLLFKFK